MRANQMMESPALSVGVHSSLEEVARFLVRADLDSAPVVDSDGILLGIVSRLDVLGALCTCLATEGSSPDEARLTQPWEMREESRPMRTAPDLHSVMRRCAYMAHQHTPAPILCCLMLEHNTNSIPIIANNRLVGQVTDASLLELILNRDEVGV